jgi:4,5-dihydroxyphthalate decarboxylase
MRILIERDDLARAAIEAAHAAKPGLQLERLDIRPAHRGFRRFVNDGAIDVSELAIVTLLQAVAYDKPVVLLPIATLSRSQHRTLVTCQDRGPGELAGATVGVRSWSQTTGVWLRGILAHELQIDLRAIGWVVFDDGHVSEQPDPSWVRHAPRPLDLEAEFLATRLDYAIFGNELPADSRVHAAIPDADLAAARFARREGFVPVNHVLAATLTAARRHGEVVCAAYDALASVLAAPRHGATRPGEEFASEPNVAPVGFAALRAPFTRAAQYAFEQELLPRRVEFDEVVARSCEALGVPPSRLDPRLRSDR